jgi:hemoglobin
MRGATTFETLGGFARVRLIVSDFYDKVLESERLAPYFAGVDMRRLIDHQTKFIAAVMGGPAAFSDEQMQRAHRRLGITTEDFDEMALLFRETLEDFGVREAELERLHAHVLSMRMHVVSAPAQELPA